MVQKGIGEILQYLAPFLCTDVEQVKVMPQVKNPCSIMNNNSNKRTRVSSSITSPARAGSHGTENRTEKRVWIEIVKFINHSRG